MDLDGLIDEHFRHEAADDVDAVLATMTEDATHQLIGSPYGVVTGAAAIRRFYETLFGDVQGLGVEPIGRWHGDGVVVDEVLWTGRIHEARCFGFPGRGAVGIVTFRLLHVFTLRGDLIASERVWVDAVAIDHQLNKESNR